MGGSSGLVFLNFSHYTATSVTSAYNLYSDLLTILLQINFNFCHKTFMLKRKPIVFLNIILVILS